MPKGRHSSEDLAYLRERGFVKTAEEIERLHKVEDQLRSQNEALREEIQRLKVRIDVAIHT